MLVAKTLRRKFLKRTTVHDVTRPLAKSNKVSHLDRPEYRHTDTNRHKQNPTTLLWHTKVFMIVKRNAIMKKEM